VTIVEVRLEANARVEQQLPPGYNGFVVVLEGGAMAGSPSTLVSEKQIAWLTLAAQASVLTLAAGTDGLRTLIFAGEPLRKPVAARVPFVMNTQAELDVGLAEFHSQGDRFGVPHKRQRWATHSASKKARETAPGQPHMSSTCLRAGRLCVRAASKLRLQGAH